MPLIPTLGHQWKSDSLDKRRVVVYSQQRFTGLRSAHRLNVRWRRLTFYLEGEMMLSLFVVTVFMSHTSYLPTHGRESVTVQLWCEPSCSLQRFLRVRACFGSISNSQSLFVVLFFLHCYFCKMKVFILLHISRHKFQYWCLISDSSRLYYLGSDGTIDLLYVHIS